MDSRILHVHDFIEAEVPKIINGRGRLRAVLTTYNQIRDYEDGKITTGDPNLQMKILVGGLGVPSMSFMMNWAIALDTDAPRAHAIREDFKVQALNAQAAVNHELDEEKRPDLVLMYAGLRGFGMTTQKCIEIREKFPKAYVGVLACDCDMHQKVRGFTSLLQSGVLNSAIITPDCGGRRDMRDLLEAFVAQWPERTLPERKKKTA